MRLIDQAINKCMLRYFDAIAGADYASARRYSGAAAWLLRLRFAVWGARAHS
jgi:hypothetical protein